MWPFNSSSDECECNHHFMEWKETGGYKFKQITYYWADGDLYAEKNHIKSEVLHTQEQNILYCRLVLKEERSYCEHEECQEKETRWTKHRIVPDMSKVGYAPEEFEEKFSDVNKRMAVKDND